MSNNESKFIPPKYEPPPHDYVNDIMITDFMDYLIRYSMHRVCHRLNFQDSDEMRIRWDSIPEEQIQKWQDYIFNFDVTQWKTRDPQIALDPYDSFNHPEYTTNELLNILKIRAYEVEDEIIEYLIKITDQIPEDKKEDICFRTYELEQELGINKEIREALEEAVKIDFNAIEENTKDGPIPSGHFNIDDLWCDTQYDVINEVIGSAISHIQLYIRDFKPKWSDIPKEKIYEWHDFVFAYDTTLWKPCDDDRALPHVHYGNETGSIIEYRLYDLRDIISKFFMDKFNIEIADGKYRYKEKV